MENASKALLIAGSVLIAILLIAAGVSIYTSTQGTTDSVETTMNATEIATFNGKFTSYLGTKNKAQVMSLLNTIIANNATNSIHQVGVTLSGTVTTAQSAISNLSKQIYTISVTTTDYTAGYITNINID